MNSSHQVRAALWTSLFLAGLLRLLAWRAFPNTIWPDELFQSLEQAHRVVFGFGVVPWEFRDGTRSWLLPGVLAGVIAATSIITSSVWAYLGACAAMLSAISLAPVWAAFRTSVDQFGLRSAIVVAAFIGTWFELVFFAPKALNEVVGGNCLAVGVLLCDACLRSLRKGSEPKTRTVVVVSILLALASMLRIQLSVAAFPLYAYLFYRLPRTARWRSLVAAASVVVALGLLDWITWRYPFQSYVENVRVNILVGRSAHYGTAPWYAYFAVYGRIWGVWGLGVLALAGVGARIRPLIAFAAVAVLATHIPIGHKEYRFAYPAMVMVIILAGLGAAQLLSWIEQKTTKRVAMLATLALLVVWVSASLQRATELHESKTRLAVTFGPSQWHWELHRGGLVALEKLGQDRSVCGIGLMGVNVFNTGGYTYLHRNIPLFETLTRKDVVGLAPYVNVYLVSEEIAATGDHFGQFVRDGCYAEVCVYRRTGSCQAMPGYSFNKVLEARGD